MSKWVKQLTREGTLLDRSLRAWAYYQSVPAVGKARFAKCPNVGQGRLVSWYYEAQDYTRTQATIVKEFRGKDITVRAAKMIKLLESAYAWLRLQQKAKFTTAEFPSYLRQLQNYHAYGRGAIVYSYWGEPAITARLKTSLRQSVPEADMDYTLSLLSAPQSIDSPLNKLFHSASTVQQNKRQLLAKLHLNKQQQELVTVLSWFTLFYELGERISSPLQDNLDFHLKRLVKNKQQRDMLQWYDQDSLLRYFENDLLLSETEIARRKSFYIVSVKSGKLDIVSGQKAKNYFLTHFPQDQIVKTNELKGTIASRGQARGPVKIVVTQDDQKKMKKGDILVSPMTTPRLMIAVEKAAAIVTDEGGLTAHAAIVSREFGIPCIVGTKYATKVFKDDDLVEVDGDKGIIRKI